MMYGDFSSVVQLGVGLHVGTALLQLYGELGLQPLVRSIARTRSLFLEPEAERPRETIKEALDLLEGRYDIFRIQLFQEYRTYVVANSCVASALAVTLVFLAFAADVKIADGMEWTAILMVGASLLPAPALLYAFWRDASRRVKPMLDKARELEMQAVADA